MAAVLITTEGAPRAATVEAVPGVDRVVQAVVAIIFVLVLLGWLTGHLPTAIRL